MSKRTLRPITQRRVYKSTAVELSEIALHTFISSQELLEPIVAQLHQRMTVARAKGLNVQAEVEGLVKRMSEVK